MTSLACVHAERVFKIVLSQSTHIDTVSLTIISAGAFVTHDNTGVSAIIGSSAFNVFVIIALCSLAAGGVSNGGSLYLENTSIAVCDFFSFF